MRLFALLLFSIEFMAPSLLVSSIAAEGQSDYAKFTNHTANKNILYAAFIGELNENEESNENQRISNGLAELSFVSSFLKHAIEDLVLKINPPHTVSRFNTRPALFKVNCTYLI